MSSKKPLRFCGQGGAVPKYGDFVYVPRTKESELYEHLLNSVSVNLHGARHIGKTTIAISVANRLKKKGHAVAWVNLQTHISASTKGDKWSDPILHKLSQDLELDVDRKTLNDWIKKHGREPFADLFRDFFGDLVVQEEQFKGRPISVFIDEIDYTQKLLEFTDNLFDGIRAIYNEPSGVGHDHLIAFTLIGLCQPYELFKNSEIPFSIGQQIELRDFEKDEDTAAKLAEGFANPVTENCKKVALEILGWTGGQPYLTILLCDEFKRASLESPAEVKPMMISFIKDQKRYPIEHFKAPSDLILRFKERAYRALTVYKDILRGGGEPNQDWGRFYSVLRMAGLTVFDQRGFWKVKSPIYERYFDEVWFNAFANQIGVELPQEGDYFPPVVYGQDEPKLFVLNTGGTIGMEVQSNGSVRRYTNAEDFIRNFRDVWRVFEDRCEIIFEEIACKDGANILPKDWSTIARKVWQLKNEGKKRGIVITHGTDTMAYTASAVAYALGPGLDFPVVFTGSQTTYTVTHGDAKSNLLRACLVALEGSIKEVVICFGDVVYRGCRAQKKHDQKFEGFESPSYKPLAYITEKVNVQNELLLRKDGLMPFELKDSFAEEVLQLIQYPSLNPGFLRTAINGGELKGLIIQTLGVGNVPTIGRYSLIPSIEEACRKGIPVLVTSQYPVNPEVRIRYKPASSAIDAGAIPGGNMTSAAAVTKFQWVIAQVEAMIARGDLRSEMKIKEIRRMMNINYVGEVDKPIVEGEESRPERNMRNNGADKP